MEIKKVTTVTPMTTDDKPMEAGKRYLFDTSSGCFAGEFLGLSHKGAVMFAGVINGSEVKFNVLPRCIAHIFEAEIYVKGDKSNDVRES